MTPKEQLENAGCTVHREYREYGKNMYIVEKHGILAKMYPEYGTWYKQECGGSLMPIEKFTDYVLKTEAKSNTGHTYEVVIQKGFEPMKFTLKVRKAPGQWYLKTLFEGGYDPEQKELYLDYGQDWKVINYDEIMAEVVEHIGSYQLKKYTRGS